MDAPIPQPYDITEIPYIAWSPGLSTWAAVLLGIAVYGLIVWRKFSTQGKRSEHTVIEGLLAELSALAQQCGELPIERASRIARRLLSHLSGVDLIHLTSKELSDLVLTTTDSEFSEIVAVVAALEDAEYAPPSDEREHNARALIGRLTRLTRAYRDTRRDA